MQKIVHIIGQSAKASVEKLHKEIGFFEGILQRGFKVKKSKTTYIYVASDIHIEHTTPNLNCNCNKNEGSENSEHTQINNMAFDHEKKAYEKIEKSKTESTLPSKNSKSLQIKPKILTQALHHVAMFVKNRACNLKEI
ncbi:hypothetical protein [Bartonella tribocorum]|uniref:Uncharacterized protein n=1 Tax=Bartonella tribocorum TaxID=85701 RepID=A0A2M6USQ1_9HYPH|nr:hypothetical protein [Bartonella tribocorum]PIT69230.1 hypothetical protein CER18_04250 [Bartonella tribocorum]